MPRRPSSVSSQADTCPADQTGRWRRPALPRFHGRYLLEKRLGVGGMGAVYRATPVQGGEPVAIKILSEHLTSHEGAERFRREIEALEDLRHPNVVRLLDHGWVESQPFFVMELVRGPDLTRLVTDDGAQPASRVCGVLRQLADALVYAHEQGFIHRDIKPSNVILGWDEEIGEVAKLLDFGLVLGGRDADNRLTAEDMLLGTPGYMAPEGAKSAHALGPRSDLFALAMIAFHLRTGKHLFRPVDIVCEQSHRKALERGWQTLREEGGLPGPVEHVLWRCLRFDPARRPESGQAIIDVLDQLPFVPRWPETEARTWWDRYAASTRSQLKAKKSARST